MAERYIRIGSSEEILCYDDADYNAAVETDAPIKAGPPVDDNDVLRLGDILPDIVGLLYPIGSLYITTLSTNPATLLGIGTWAIFGAGRVLVGIDASDADFDTVEETGGAKTSTPNAHTGTAVAAHTKVANKQGAAAGNVVTTETHTVTQPNNHAAMSIVQPYIVVYIWKRTA